MRWQCGWRRQHDDQLIFVCLRLGGSSASNAQVTSSFDNMMVNLSTAGETERLRRYMWQGAGNAAVPHAFLPKRRRRIVWHRPNTHTTDAFQPWYFFLTFIDLSQCDVVLCSYIVWSWCLSWGQAADQHHKDVVFSPHILLDKLSFFCLITFYNAFMSVIDEVLCWNVTQIWAG